MITVKENLGIDYLQAQELLEKYISNKNTRLHSIETEAIMRKLAKHFGENEEEWGIIGLLHDIDWDLTKENTIEHCRKSIEILKNAGATSFLIEAVISHGYGNNLCGAPQDKQRKTTLQYCLASAETVTGLIIAASLMQPERSVLNLKLESLKKKFKDKKFAANCNRDVILECEKTGVPLDDFLKLSLESLQEISDKLA